MSRYEPTGILDYRSDGKAVCFDHQLRVCGRCCVDYTYDGESDTSDFDSDDYDPDNSDALSAGDYDTGFTGGPDDRQVLMLVGATARFNPQWDGEVQGPADLIGLNMDSDNPPTPTPPSELQFVPCRTCDLVWLCGEKGMEAATSHPSHRTCSHAYAGTSRSLVVYIDGACANNGSSTASGGVGVFFGKDSRYNVSETIAPKGGKAVTSQKAELAAVARAIKIVRTRVVPEREVMCGNEVWDGGSPGWDMENFRLVVATDSSYVVESLCKHREGWVEDEDGMYRTKKGKVIMNTEGFKKVEKEVKKLAKVGVQVVYYQVPRAFNGDADRLAKMAAGTD